MSVLPDKVSHGGTYAGNRVAAAAAVKTLEIIRDTDALETIHATGRRDPGRPARDPQPEGPAVPLHRPPVDVRDHVLRGRGDRVPRLGRRPTTSCTTRSPSGCTPAARCPSPIRASRGSCARRTPQGDIVDRVVTIFSRLARRGARGARPRRHAPARSRRRCRTRRQVERDRSGMVLDGNAVRSVDRAAALLLALGETPGRGRRDRARPPARAAQVDRVAAAGHAPEARPRRAGRRDRQVPARPRRHPPRRTRRADARPARDRHARARAARPPDPRDDRPRASSTATRC